MIIISAIAFVLAACRFIMLPDDYVEKHKFTLIKSKAPELPIETDEDTGAQRFILPEIFTEPFLVDLEFTKYLFDNELAIFLDAREEEEYSIGHIPSSINLPYDYLDEYIETLESLDRDATIVIYCSGDECSLSFDLAEYMFFDLETPFSKLLIFESGMPVWEDAGYPVE